MAPPDDAISNEKLSSVDYNFALDDRYSKSDGVVYLTGMQALVRLLIEQIDLDRREIRVLGQQADPVRPTPGMA